MKDNFSTLSKVHEKSSALSCRAIWSVNEADTAQKLIVNTRSVLDEVISGISGIQFFISSVTGTTTNTNKTTSVRPGIAYFIVFRRNSEANESAIFKYLHDSGMEATVTEIRSKNSKDGNYSVLQGLKQVVKVNLVIFK